MAERAVQRADRGGGTAACVQREQDVRGVVILELRIGADGSVKDATVVRSIPLLDDAALTAARQWKFQPVLLNGAPVDVIMTSTVSFAQ